MVCHVQFSFFNRKVSLFLLIFSIIVG
jgi:hypothetical protein